MWGYRKTVRSRTLVTTVYRLRRKVEADPGEPRNIVQVYGTGYRFVAEQVEQEVTAPGNLPASRDAFVGRHRELDALAAELSEARLITLTGPGGTGKTRLALELAAREGARFESGAWVVDLSGAFDRVAVLRAVARTLRVPLTASDPASQLANALRYRGRLLLVIDNCEQVIDEVADPMAWRSARSSRERSTTSWSAVTARSPAPTSREPCPCAQRRSGSTGKRDRFEPRWR